MRVVVVYKGQRDYTRAVLEYLHDFERRTGHVLETLDPDTREGVSFTKSYDLLEFPVVVALSADGQLQNQWRGLPLPTINEVSYYVESN